MTTWLHDLQEPEDTVVTPATVAEVLRRYRERAPFIAELRSDAACKLTVGIAPTYGFVQHSPVDGNPPYLVACSPRAHTSGSMQFLITSTPTEISNKYRLATVDLVAIISFFIATGARSDAYRWESI